MSDRRQRGSWSRRDGCDGGFTLLELLVVVGLIAALSFFILGGLGGGRKSAALRSAQATMANLVAAARIKAMAGGHSARVLINVDPGSDSRPRRFLRYVVLQVQVDGAWQGVTDAYLPDGVYVVPGNFSSIPGGLFAADTAAPWTKPDGSALRSTALRSSQISAEAVNSAVAEQWVNLGLSAVGTTAQAGDIILAAGKLRAPGSYAAGESPVELGNPEAVCGVTLSSYGVPVLINSRAGF